MQSTFSAYRYSSSWRRMVVIGFDEGMPKIAARRVLHKVQRLQRGINRLPKFRHSNDIAHLERFLLVCLSAVTQHSIPVDLQERYIYH